MARDRAKQRAAQLAFWHRRRRAWLAANGPCATCGSTERLEVDHKDPAPKVSHRIWSWSEVRRAAELAKCQVLCRKCHEAKTAREQTSTGVWTPRAKLTPEDVAAIRASTESGRDLAARYGVHRSTINRTRARTKWKHLP